MNNINIHLIDKLPRYCLRVLQVVMAFHEAGKTVTISDITRQLGWKSPYLAHQTLRRLRNAGLIDYQDRKGGTIQATCYFRGA